MELNAAAHGPPRRATAISYTRVRPRRHLRRVLTIACLVALTPAFISYAATMVGPSNSSIGIRTVEWLREHGAAGLVSQVESIYYSLTAPAKGGPALRALPRVGVASSPSRVSRASASPGIIDHPARIRPLALPALPGEGVWHTTQAGVDHNDPPLLVSTFRSDPGEYPRLVAGVAWINTSRTTTSMYPGMQEPSVTLPNRGLSEVPPGNRRRLLATFNSGFKLADSSGGWALFGHTYAPMRAGEATFVRYADGRYNVTPWRGGSAVASNVVFARQNLPLIVRYGRPSPNLSDGPE
jgi:hypothetical protein